MSPRTALRHFLLLPLLLCAACSDSTSSASGRRHVAFVSNCVDPFWTLAAAGARNAGREFDVEVSVEMPPTGQVSEQKRIVEQLLARGIDGIAISPIDGRNQADLVNEACARTHVITHDSDAPGTDRRCFIAIDNYVAGRECGKLVREALPDGGSVMIFIGRLEQHNSKLRRQGVIDELLERSFDPSRYDSPSGGKLEGERYTILDTRTDGGDHARAKANAEDAITRFPDLGAMVGLFAYNPPACLEALDAAGKLGAIQVIGFDEQDATLQGIVDGTVFGTISQDPYWYGYHSVRITAGLARGDESVLPEDGYLETPPKVVKHDNVREFWDRRNELLSTGDE